MDRRKINTRRDINLAFEDLLKTKSYADITIQEILDNALISRSTFYEYYKTKDALLNDFCERMFHHVFENHSTSEQGHDFSMYSGEDFLAEITHIFYHVKEDLEFFPGLISPDSIEIFLKFVRTNFATFLEERIKETNNGIPLSYRITYIAGGLVETINWWINDKFKTSPENLAKFYFSFLDI